MRWNHDRSRAAVSTVKKREPPQSYSVLLRYVANQLSEEVFGQSLVPSFKGLNKYTGMQIIDLFASLYSLQFVWSLDVIGFSIFLLINVGELLGVEYLYDQTGQVLQVIQGDAPETDDIGGDANDEDSDDEGFDEALAFNDPTIAPPQFIIDQPARQSTTTRQAFIVPLQAKIPGSKLTTYFSRFYYFKCILRL